MKMKSGGLMGAPVAAEYLPIPHLVNPTGQSRVAATM
jgi:hypothetical protein